MNLTGQWADSLLDLERFFLLQVAMLGAMSTLMGTALVALGKRSGAPAPLLDAFGVGLAIAGSLELAGSLGARPFVTMRDFESAVALDRALWLAIGVLGTVAVATLTRTRAMWTTRGTVGPQDLQAVLRGVGGGAALSAHAVALALLALQLATSIVR